VTVPSTVKEQQGTQAKCGVRILKKVMPSEKTSSLSLQSTQELDRRLEKKREKVRKYT
jgi:hypothetical protein